MVIGLVAGEVGWWTLEISKVVVGLIVGLVAAGIAWRQVKIARRQAEIAQTQADNAKTQIEVARIQAEVAARQAETAARKLNMDLFDRRYKIYDATRLYLNRIYSITTREQDAEFARDTKEAEFLFGNDLVKFLRGLVKLASRLRTNTERRSRAIEDKHHERVLATTDANDVLVNTVVDAEEMLYARFRPYLNLGTIQEQTQGAAPSVDVGEDAIDRAVIAIR